MERDFYRDRDIIETYAEHTTSWEWLLIMTPSFIFEMVILTFTLWFVGTLPEHNWWLLGLDLLAITLCITYFVLYNIYKDKIWESLDKKLESKIEKKYPTK